MSASALPGVVWVVLLLALIPGVQQILEQFFPSTEYWYSALIVALLSAIAKAVEVWARQTYPELPHDIAPAADFQPGQPHQPPQARRLQRWLLG
jgi:hypothetical protein